MVTNATTLTDEPCRFEIGDSFDLGIFEQKGVSFAKAVISDVPGQDTIRVVVLPQTKVFRQAQINTPLYVRRTHPTGVYMLKTVVIARSTSHLMGILLQHNNNWAHVQRRDSERLPVLKDEALIVNAVAIDEYHRRHLHATLQDISSRGICLLTDERIEWAEKLQIELALKEPFGRVTLELQVLHKSHHNHPESDTNDTLLRIGGTFVSPDDETQHIINNFVMQEIADRYACAEQTSSPVLDDAVRIVSNELVQHETPPDEPAS